ncbi:hypothetical protein GCM10009750_13960 [Agromyces salentinus]|uniref:Uncharacterized protein n=1 Tax=Agromyces salentinus TaxID=269421 RepID=A0ABN2MPD1_9MICO
MASASYGRGTRSSRGWVTRTSLPYAAVGALRGTTREKGEPACGAISGRAAGRLTIVAAVTVPPCGPRRSIEVNATRTSDAAPQCQP